MDDSQEGKETAQLIASEASAGAKGGRGDNLSGSDKVALKKKKNREKQARYRANMSAAQKRPRAHETEAQHTERKRKERERSATRWLNLPISRSKEDAVVWIVPCRISQEEAEVPGGSVN